MDNATVWKIIDTYFHDNPQALVKHHIDSYNDFFKTSIYQIFKEKNPVRIHSRQDPKTKEYMSRCDLYMGGKNGNKIYFGKPVINDDNNAHYMFPNEARLRNMTYGMTIHYDIDVEFVDILRPGEMPTIIGTDVENELENKGVILGGQEYFDDSYSNNNDSNSSSNNNNNNNNNGTRTSANEKRETRNEDRDDIEAKMFGGAPRPTNIKPNKKTLSNTKPLEITTDAAARIRDATEKSLSGIAGTTTQTRTHTLSKVYLGKFPIMLQSDFCILSGLPKDVRHTAGECRNDPGGYFIIDGKEKTVVAQEKFADNMLYIRKSNDDKYLYSAEIRSVSENVSKPVRTLSVKIVAPTKKLTNGNIVVNIPNVRSPVPLFIVFRALGILSDKSIIEHCLLDIDKYENMVDLFIPSVHDSATILTQQNAINYIALLTKGKSSFHALEILADYFLPHVGEINYIPKAYALGAMVFRLLAVSQKTELPTDRDNFKYKRVELVGSLLYDLFREYWNIQLREVHLEFEKKLYYNQERYENDLYSLILDNYRDVFKERSLEIGFRKAFKGNWGAQIHTKRIGVVQDLNRLSFNSALNHMRKTNLPLDSSVKLVGPRVLHNSQWGYIDPIDTPDGGSIGLNKHLAISTYITRGMSREPMVAWLREKWGMKLVEEFSPRILSQMTKVIINGCWIGVVNEPIGCIEKYRLYKRNALLPIYTSATFDIRTNTIFVYTDAGRLCRPIFYRDETTGIASYMSKKFIENAKNEDLSWTDLVSGFNKKRPNIHFDTSEMKIYELFELYEGVETETNPAVLERFLTDKAIIDYLDTSESENAFIALNAKEFETGRIEDQNSKLARRSKHTHCEIHNSFILGMMCNMIIFPENNPAVRNSFSCGQSKQACSMYNTNYQVRMDKAAVLLNYGQIPLIKSRYLEHITGEEHSYGENAIVAIACYTGYNVEDAILINEGALNRGLFRTTYFTCYEAHEESTKNSDTVVDHRFMNIDTQPAVLGTKPGYDYGKLDKYGIIREGTIVDDKTVLIGLATVGSSAPGSAIAASNTYLDDSKIPKKGQLGVVEKAFITDGEEGQRIAKVRIMEQRIPTLGDKMASRAGQKGTIGLVIPERDMPFTAEGIRPDIIINPHALPTRMTIGQLVECIMGKACASYGGFGDCSAFNNDGSKIGVFGQMLPKMGFHSSGNEILYNGMTGVQMETEIFMGPTYYMRLKHMVKDKVNYRALGPRTALTKQPVSGRANDGGLRIGEMERDTLISHGMTDFLRESMMERGDKSYLAVCNNSGMISVYNPAKGLFMSPMADGPLQFVGSLEGNDLRVEQITKFGRSFSVVCIPYSLKLLIQELQTINVQLRIITDDNIDQIENMAYSDNIQKLTKSTSITPKTLIQAIKETLMKKAQITLSDNTKLQLGYMGTNIQKDSVDSIDNSDSVDSSNSSSSIGSSSSDSNSTNTETQNSPDDYVSPVYRVNSEEGSQNDYVSPVYRVNSEEEGSHTPESPPPARDFKFGDIVFRRTVDDGYPEREWRITRIADKFLTINAVDQRGLTNDQSIQVVSDSDIIHPHQIMRGGGGGGGVMGQFDYRNNMPNHYDNTNTLSPYSMNTRVPAQSMPNIVIAPKFFSGGGNDNSTGQSPSYDDNTNNIVSTASQQQNGGATISHENINNNAISDETIDFKKGFLIKKSG